MGLKGADNFLLQFGLFRQCWIKGRLGGGKTLLAFAVADEQIKRKVVRGCVSNVPNALPVHPWREEYQDGNLLIRESVVVYDEAWVKLDNRTSVTNDRTYGAFSRKLGVYILYPSVIPIDKRQSYLSCQRVWRFSVPVVSSLVRLLVGSLDAVGKLEGKGALLGRMARLVRRLARAVDWLAEDVWVYRWSVELGYMKDEGTFYLIRPSQYFNLYDTKHIPLDDGDIGALWERTIMEEVAGDVTSGQWYIEVDEETGEPITDEVGIGVGFGQGYEQDEADDYISARAFGNDTAKVRGIAYPFSDRPSVVVDPNDY